MSASCIHRAESPLTPAASERREWVIAVVQSRNAARASSSHGEHEIVASWCLVDEQTLDITSIHVASHHCASPADLVFMLEHVAAQSGAALREVVCSRNRLPPSLLSALQCEAERGSLKLAVVKSKLFQFSQQSAGRMLSVVHAIADTCSAEACEAAAALLRHVGSIRGSLSAGEGQGAIPRQIVMENFADCVMVSQEALWCLQIVGPALSHGATVFALLDRCRSTSGKRQLRSMLLKPTTCLELLASRQRSVQACMRACRADPGKVGSVVSSLEKLKSPLAALRKIRLAKAKHSDWIRMRQCLHALASLCQELRGWPVGAGGLGGEACASFSAEVSEVEAALHRLVDIDTTRYGTQDENLLVVQEGADGALDETRAKLARAPELLQQVSAAEWPNLRLAIGELFGDSLEGSLAHHPQLGVVWVIKAPNTAAAQDTSELATRLAHRQGKVVFVTPTELFIEDEVSLTVHNVVAHLPALARQRQFELQHTLEELVLRNEGVILDAMDVAGELDACLAISAVALERGFCQATLVDAGRSCSEEEWLVKGMRHPLQELVCETFVSNSLSLHEPGTSKRVTVIFGPNSSGKSCILRQVGAAQLLSQSVGWVAAETASFSVVDRVFTRMASREAGLGGDSSFVGDLRQVAQMLRHATSQSLLIVDEFGKGTLHADGVALLAACLAHVQASARDVGPTVVVATHYSEILGLLAGHGSVQALHMQCAELDGDVRPIFELKCGPGSGAHAAQCAAAVSARASVL